MSESENTYYMFRLTLKKLLIGKKLGISKFLGADKKSLLSHVLFQRGKHRCILKDLIKRKPRIPVVGNSEFEPVM